MEISITGASGDVGGAFLATSTVVSKGKIKALIRKGRTFRSRPDKVPIERFEFHDGYVYDADFISQFVASDALIHFAALLDSNETGFADYIAINSIFTGLLATASLDQASPPKFVYISSERVYCLPACDLIGELAHNFLDFCAKHFISLEGTTHDLRSLALTFISENRRFSYGRYNRYALTKYLGEAIALQVPGATILRLSSAYGPEYSNPRLIPRLIVSRLTGNDVFYNKEKRDFVYSADINAAVDTAISKNLLGVIDCKSDEIVDTDDVRDIIILHTPTAYGDLRSVAAPTSRLPSARAAKAARMNLAAIVSDRTPFSEGILATLFSHKEKCYHDMTGTHGIRKFLRPGERVVKHLKGSSGAYLCVVAGQDHIQKVRKIAVREGVEGNGIAKVANEILYYKHIARHQPGLARLYPQLLDSETSHDFASETIEYLDGINYYAALQANDLPYSVYEEALRQLIDKLGTFGIEKCTSMKNSEKALGLKWS